MSWGLPFAEVWLVDFEFIADPGERPVPVCMVAKELKGGRILRVWQDELGRSGPPFRTDDEVLFVAYNIAAEVGCFLELGWPIPTRWLDLYVEFKNETNNVPLAYKRDLLGALRHHGLVGITKEQKDAGRGLVMRGGPWSTGERQAILDYCQTDVDALAPLLDRMLPAIEAHPHGLAHALIRSRYMIAVAKMTRTGVPIDVVTFGAMRAGWEGLKVAQIASVNETFGVYEGLVFKEWRFDEYLTRNGMAWPRTPQGHLRRDDDTLKDMAELYPQLHRLRSTMKLMTNLKELKLTVGADGRNRTGMFPFGTITGRNTPSTTEFIFQLPSWLRSLIKPPPGRGVAYIDWSAQEVWIAAVLSGDEALLTAVQTGDPYLAFAKVAGLVPSWATKKTHKKERGACKIAVLGTNYGMQAGSLALQTGISIVQASDMLRRLRLVFPRYFAWRDDQGHGAQLDLVTETLFGWRAHVQEVTGTNTLLNFPMQGNGSEMMRIAASLVTESGIELCCTVHDALLIEADVGDLEAVVARTRDLMAEASRIVLDGLEVRTDVDLVTYPDRYVDERDHDENGRGMWHLVMARLAAAAAA